MSTRFGRTILVALVGAIAALPSLGAPADRSPDGLWRSADARALAAPAVRVTAFRGAVLDLAAMKRRLAQAPLERTSQAVSPQLITLPMPDGSFQRFGVVESVMFEPGLAEKFPQIRTYRGQGLDDAAATCALDVTVQGFHAQVLAPSGRVLVDPAAPGNMETYVSYFTRDALPTEPFRCYFKDGQPGSYEVTPSTGAVRPLAASGTNLRTYRLALAADGEYTTKVCSPNPAAIACGLSAMTTAMNRVNQVYEQEVAIHMTMVANENLIIYTDGTTDPYTNDDGGTMLDENQANLDSVIGSANYDIGHVFSTGGGGIAGLRVPCKAGQKAWGVTGLTNPVGDAFYIDYVAHEMGHEWGGNHTFNGTSGSCGGNRAVGAAYEPGSASTIMGYAGICAPENLQAHSDPYFHVKSFDEIVAYSTGPTGSGCAVVTATGNSAPTVNAGSSYTIPKQTPFTLTGSATDPDGDALTYCWEEFDLGAQAPPNDDVAAIRPIFRSFNPAVTGSRTIPKLANILSGTATIGESMSTQTRTMTFRLTARDNKAGGGGVNYASTTVNVDGTTGPFVVTAPTTGAVWNGGALVTVTWNVAGTTGGTVNCANVSILLSTDGGNTFPTTLLASTPNDGTETFAAPTGITTATARVRVGCVGNIFFDISNPNFTMNPTALELQRFAVE